MRSRLKNLYNQKINIKATFTKVGSFHTQTGEKMFTLLVQNIQLTNGKPLADHLWIQKPDDIDELNLQRGQYIQFSATVGRYCRIGLDGNYYNDFELKDIENLRRI